MKQLIFTKKYIDPLIGKIFRPGDCLEIEDKLAEVLVGMGFAKYTGAKGKTDTKKNTKRKVKAPAILKAFTDYQEVDLSHPVGKQIEVFKKKFEHIKTGETLFYIVVQEGDKVRFLQIDDEEITRITKDNVRCYIVAEMFWH